MILAGLGNDLDDDYEKEERKRTGRLS